MKYLINILLIVYSYMLSGQTIPYKQLGSSGLNDRLLISTSNGYQEVSLSSDFNISNSTISTPYNGPWLVNGSNVYRTDINLGVGTSSPSTRLHTKGNLTLEGENSTDKWFSGLGFRRFNNSTNHFDILIDPSTSNAPLQFRSNNNLDFNFTSATNGTLLEVRNDGNVRLNSLSGATTRYIGVNSLGIVSEMPEPLGISNGGQGSLYDADLLDGEEGSFYLDNPWITEANNRIWYDNFVGVGAAPLYNLHTQSSTSNASIRATTTASGNRYADVVVESSGGFATFTSRTSDATGTTPLTSPGPKMYSVGQNFNIGTFSNRDLIFATNSIERGMMSRSGDLIINNLSGVDTRMVTTNSIGLLGFADIPDVSAWSTFPAIQNVALGSNWINNDADANKGFRWVSTDYMQVETQSTSPIIATFSNGNAGTISLSNESTGEWSLGTAAKISGLSNNFVKLSIGNTDFEFDDVGLVLPEYSSGTVEDGTLYRDATTGRLMWYDPDLLQDREVAMISDTETTQTTYTTNTAIGVGTDIVYLDYSTNQTHTLTLASNLEDKKLTIMNIGTANATIDGFSNQTIMGSATYVLAPNESITLNTPVGSTDIKVISKN